MPPIIGGDEEMATGDKGEDPLLEETYLLQDMEAPLHASTAAKKGTMHKTALKRNSYPTTKESKPTLLT